MLWAGYRLHRWPPASCKSVGPSTRAAPALPSSTSRRISTASGPLCFDGAWSTCSHLHLPQEISDLLGHFYQGAQRIFCMSQALSGRWGEISMGIAQGCPLSPMLASAIGHIWCSWIRSSGPSDGPRCLSYVDDRTLWVPAGSPSTLLQPALHSSQEFDRAFGFALSLDKIAIVTRDPDPHADAPCCRVWV